MAAAKTNTLSNSLLGFGRLPVLRQFGLMAGLAASVALGVALVLWSQKPSYRMLYNGLSDQDVAAVTTSLQSVGIPYEINTGSGMVMVPSDQVRDARLKLASQGLPKGSATGFDLLDKEQGFGTSQFMENARYQRALEGELASTIGRLSSVQGARVHLAIPRQSAFLRDHDQKSVSASVMLQLGPGRELQEGQVAAIVHLVASSVPNLDPDQVTVVDQRGRLLTSAGMNKDMQLSATQFDYKRRLEDYYTQRIETIVTPLTGQGKVRAQVAADLDFSVTEQSQESYNPDLPAVRSEQTVEESSRGPGGASGVPGALTNQPPAAGAVGAAAAGTALAASALGTQETAPQNSSRRTVRNYELDHTISHTRMGSGAVHRLSVAVVVDDHELVNESGETTHKPLTAQEVERITTLVKEAVGFDAQRGDTVNVINASFTIPPVQEAAPEPSLLDKPGVMDLVKQIGGGVLALLLAFFILRPVLRSLAEKGVALPLPAPPMQYGSEMNSMGDGRLNLSGQQGMAQLPGPSNYDQQMAMARTIVNQDPKRVAQVVKTWVSSEG